MAFDGGIYGTVYAKTAPGTDSGYANIKKANGEKWQPSFSIRGKRYTLPVEDSREKAAYAMAVHMAAVAAGDAVHPSPQKRIKVEAHGAHTSPSACYLPAASPLTRIRMPSQVRRGRHSRRAAATCRASS